MITKNTTTGPAAEAEMKSMEAEEAGEPPDLELKRLSPKQLKRLQELVAAEQARRTAGTRDTSGAGQMTDSEFQRWASEQTRASEKQIKQKEAK